MKFESRRTKLALSRFARGVGTIVVAAIFLIGNAAAAHEFRVGAITIDHPWSRAIPPRAPTAAGYLVIRNAGPREDKLIGAQSPMANTAEFHEMSVIDNVMRMRPIEGGIAIPPGGEIRLAPNGRHLMLIGPKEGFVQGARVPLTLVFERAGRVDVELAVQSMGARDTGHAETRDHAECGDKAERHNMAEHHGEAESGGRIGHCGDIKN